MKDYKFVCNAVKWFDKMNGNTYHSVRVIRVKDKAVIARAFTYGYGDGYRQTALQRMLDACWLPGKYNHKTAYLYERENNYPILWNVSNGTKKECKLNGIV